MRGFFMLMSKYTYFVIGRSKVEILQKFDNSVLVRYVKTGVEACVNPEFIKNKTVEYQPKPNGKSNNRGNSQTKLDL